MKIAIIGHGNVGGALAQSWAAAGHLISIGARNLEEDKIKALVTQTNISACSMREAADAAEIILVATPPHIALELVQQLGELGGKILIDVTNTLQKKPDPFPTAFHAFEALTAARVVKCFNTTGFENMADPQYGPIKLDMFMAGNSQEAKEAASRLALDCGFENCFDFGDSNQVELLEKFALSWINLAIMQGYGRNIGFKVLKR